MAVLRPVVYDSGQQRQVNVGDVLSGMETIASLSTAGAGTLLNSHLVSTILNRTGPGGGFIDTTDSAANIISYLVGNMYQAANVGVSAGVGVQPGTTWRLRYINTVAFAMTLAAGTGVTLGANVNVAASSVKDYLITVTNGTPQQIFTGTTVNANAVVTGLNANQTALLTVGMLVSGTGISAGTTIASIQTGVGVTLSANATASNSNVALTFNPTITISGLGQGLL